LRFISKFSSVIRWIRQHTSLKSTLYRRRY